MGFLDHLHARSVYGRRVERLAAHMADVIPPQARVLDVGCGDGQLDRQILGRRPDLVIEGMDVLIPSNSEIP